MFEDSTFESASRIHTRSRNWMIATFALNGSILLALILIPLMYPEALPRLMTTFLMEAPPPPLPDPPPVVHLQHVDTAQLQMQGRTLFAPSVIPPHPYIAQNQEAVPTGNVAVWNEANDSAAASLFGPTVHPDVRPAVRGPIRISAPIVEGLLIRKTIPTYPPIAIATHTQGTVTLQATISRSGTIENLRVASGPAMLQRAALEAVKSWVYRPYLLNGDPVEVETTVNVVFTLQN